MSDPALLYSGLTLLASQQTVLTEDADFVPQLWHVDALVLVGDAAITPALHADVPLPIGARIDLQASNATPFTVSDANVTIHSKADKLSVAAQYSGATLQQTAEDEWWLVGDLA